MPPDAPARAHRLLGPQPPTHAYDWRQHTITERTERAKSGGGGEKKKKDAQGLDEVQNERENVRDEGEPARGGARVRVPVEAADPQRAPVLEEVEPGLLGGGDRAEDWSCVPRSVSCCEWGEGKEEGGAQGGRGDALSVTRRRTMDTPYRILLCPQSTHTRDHTTALAKKA